MRVIFMGTPDFAVPTLAALIAAPEHEVVAVYSQPPRPSGRGHKVTPSAVHQLAEQHGIAVFMPTSLKSPEAQAQFASNAADIAVVAAYGLLLPPAILQGCAKGCINVHPSDLPRWRGAAPIQRTLMAGDAATAMCIMQMDEGLDTGAVLLREPFAITPEMDAGALHDTMAAIGARATLDVLSRYDSLSPVPQQGDATYAAKMTKAEAMLDFSLPAAQLLNAIRGLSPNPAARVQLGGEEVKVFAAEVRESEGLLSLRCGDGKFLEITELQRAGRKRMSSAEALKGWDIPA